MILGNDRVSCPEWSEESRLLLGGAQAGALQDHYCSWDGLAKRMNLVGFTYEHFVSAPTNNGDKVAHTMADRSLDWLQDWLNKQSQDNVQPYEQLSKTLRRYGHHDKADQIMISANDLRRADNRTEWTTKLLLWVQGYTIGYGYRSHWALGWLFALLVIGTILGLKHTKGPNGTRSEIRRAFIYSFQELVPFIRKAKPTKLRFRKTRLICVPEYSGHISGASHSRLHICVAFRGGSNWNYEMMRL